MHTQNEVTPPSIPNFCLDAHFRLQLGADPFIKERSARVKRISLAEAHKAFLAARKGLKLNTVRDYQYCFDRYFRDWQDKPLTSITREMVAKRHTLIGQTGFPLLRNLKRDPLPSPARANMAMRYLRAVFNFAMFRYEPHIPANPVKSLSMTRGWYRIERRQIYIKEHEIKPWFKAVMALENDAQTHSRETGRDYLLFLLFTGLRRAEAAQLTWHNVDLRARTVTIPDTKNREPHLLPMPDGSKRTEPRCRGNVRLKYYDGSGGLRAFWFDFSVRSRRLSFGPSR